jgi:hypothetical protein
MKRFGKLSRRKGCGAAGVLTGSLQEDGICSKSC